MCHGCHLCDGMLMVLEPLKTRLSFKLEAIDISGDESLEDRYGTRVPVLAGECEGKTEEICYYFLNEEALQAYFSRS